MLHLVENIVFVLDLCAPDLAQWGSGGALRAWSRRLVGVDIQVITAGTVPRAIVPRATDFAGEGRERLWGWVIGVQGFGCCGGWFGIKIN
jgi:hypothetical protein